MNKLKAYTKSHLKANGVCIIKNLDNPLLKRLSRNQKNKTYTMIKTNDKKQY